MNEKKKVGMRGWNWFLSIVGLLFFSSFIFLPPIFRAVLTEDSDNQQQQTFAIKTTTVCTKVENEETTEYIIDSTDDVIDMFAQSISKNYTENDIEAIENCNVEAGLYQGVPGFHHGCRVDEGKIIVESRVQMKEYQNTAIPIPFHLDEKASVLKNSFLNVGFQCETKQHEQ